MGEHIVQPEEQHIDPVLSLGNLQIGDKEVIVDATTTTVHGHADTRYNHIAIELGDGEYHRMSISSEPTTYLTTLLLGLRYSYYYHEQPDEETVAWYKQRFPEQRSKEG